MNTQIITLAIRNDFYTPMVYYFLEGTVYPPFLKNVCNGKSRLEKEIIKRRIEKTFAVMTNQGKYGMEWFVINNECGNPIGFWGASFLLGENNGKCFLEYLLVDKNERRRGYATRLMDNFLRWTQSVGRTNIKVDFNNTDFLKRFYRKYGFAPRENDSEEKGDGLITWYRNI